MNNLITKSVNLIKSSAESDDGKITAYLTTWSHDKVGDYVKSDACDEWLASFLDDDDAVLPVLHEHQNTSVVGHWEKSSFEKDEIGLKATALIYDDVTLGRDVIALINRGMLKSVSIGFVSTSFENNSAGGRDFHSIELKECSIVRSPCNPKAKITNIKSEDGFIVVSDLKKTLRNAGLERKEIV